MTSPSLPTTQGEREVLLVYLGCSGMTYNGRGCQKWKSFPANQAPKTWRCVHHREV